MTPSQRSAARIAVAEFIRLTGRNPGSWEFLGIAEAIQHGSGPDDAARDAAELAEENETEH